MSPDIHTGQVWESGAAYERYIGRWSAAVAAAFVEWLDLPSGLSWLDVGCGTGALSAAVLDHGAPRAVVGVDQSPAFVAAARERVPHARVSFAVADAQALPYEDGTFEAVVSGLVLNFLEDPAVALRELGRVARAGGIVAVYVWDYAGGMQMLRRFWDAAVELDPAAAALDEGARFGALCSPAGLTGAFGAAGFERCETRAIDVPTTFRDFDDLWLPFLAGQGPAPAYVTSLREDARGALRECLREAVPAASDGTIALTARAWAARATV